MLKSSSYAENLPALDSNALVPSSSSPRVSVENDATLVALGIEATNETEQGV